MLHKQLSGLFVILTRIETSTSRIQVRNVAALPESHCIVYGGRSMVPSVDHATRRVLE
jgi:hypothetical protein